MNVRGEMELSDTVLISLSQNRNENKRLKTIAIFASPMTPQIAESLHLRGLYKEDGDPEEINETRTLAHSLYDVDLITPAIEAGGLRTYTPAVVKNFRIQSKDGTLQMRWTAHINGSLEGRDLLDLREQFLGKSDTFVIRLKSRQQEFKFDATAKDNQLGDGTAVPLSSGGSVDESPLFSHCIGCASGYSFNEDGLHMFPGGTLEACTKRRVTSNVSAISDVRDIEGKRKRKQLTRGELRPTPEVREEEPEVSVQ